MMELSGPERIGYIATKIYKYQFSNSHSSLRTVDKQTRMNHKQHVINAKPSELTTWFGKTFRRDASGYGNYWKPIMGLIVLIDGRHKPQNRCSIPIYG
jgi:ribosomal protein L44E